MDKVKIGVVGLGGRGRYFCNMFDSNPNSTLVAVCDKDPKVLKFMKTKWKDRVAYFTEIDDMFEKTDIDGVVVATNDPDHTEPCIKSLQYSKSVMVEKPLAQTVEDCKKIAEAVKKTKGVFMVGFELRHCVLFEKMKELIDEGKIGKVIMGIGIDNVSVGGDYYYHGKGRKKDYYKTLLLQKGSHSLDLLNYFMGGRPVRVFASGGLDVFGGKEPDDKLCRDCEKKDTCPYYVNHKSFMMDYGQEVTIEDHCVYSKDMDINDNSQLLIEYNNGARATFTECHFTPEYSREFTLIGDKGKMYGFYNNEGDFVIRVSYRHSNHIDEYRPKSTGGGHGGGDIRIINEFLKRILKKSKSNKEAMESAYDSAVLAICAEKSIEEKKVIDIPLMEV
jgi:predicted dehydrogenase